MLAMQRLQPEMKKLQGQVSRVPRTREQLNAEMMKLYKGERQPVHLEPASRACCKMPFLIVLYFPLLEGSAIP